MSTGKWLTWGNMLYLMITTLLKLLKGRNIRPIIIKIIFIFVFLGGILFFNPKYSSKKLKVSGRKTNTTLSGKPALEVKSKQDMMKNLAKAYSVTWDYNLALDMVLGSYTPSEFKKWKRMMKTEVFDKMIKEELADLLTDHGLDKTYTLELFAKVIEMAQDKKRCY